MKAMYSCFYASPAAVNKQCSVCDDGFSFVWFQHLAPWCCPIHPVRALRHPSLQIKHWINQQALLTWLNGALQA